MKIKAERKELEWTLTLSDSEMVSVYTVLHEAYNPVTKNMSYHRRPFKEVGEQTLLEHRQNIGDFLKMVNMEADRVGS